MASLRVFPLIAAISAACNNSAGPDAGNCAPAPGTFSPTAPDFVATVSQITYESGHTPAGFDMSIRRLVDSPATYVAQCRGDLEQKHPGV